MRKLTILPIILMMVFLVSAVSAEQIQSIFSGELIETSSDATSESVRLKTDSDIGVQLNILGSDNCTLSYLVSFDGSTFLAPSNGSSTTIASEFDCSSTNSFIYAFDPVLEPGWIKFKLENDSTTGNATVGSFLMYQR